MNPFEVARLWLKRARNRRSFAEAYRDSPNARPGCHSLVVVLDHPQASKNPGAIVRSADCFGARGVHVVGTRYFDPVAAMGSLARVPLTFWESFYDVHAALVGEGYTLFALEPEQDFSAPKYLHELSLPEKTAFVIGNERRGLSFPPGAFERVVKTTIAQYGGARSLNAAAAATIAMYEYARQHGKGRGA